MSPLWLDGRDGAVIPGPDGLAQALPEGARIGYLVAAMLGTATTTSLFTYRLKSISRLLKFRHLKPLHYMQFAVYILGICFSVSAAITTFGVGLNGPTQCQAAIILCLTFYLGQKILLYLFLVERTQVIRAQQTPRHKNWVYLGGTAVVVVGFSTVAVISFMWMNSEYDSGTGQCFIGLPAKVALPLLTYDISINLLLTGVFLHYVRPYLQGGLVNFFFDRKQTDPAKSRSRSGEISLPQQKLKRIIRKTFWGCILIMPSTIANMTVLAVMKGHQAGWMCLTFCTLDVLWCTIVIHWLTAPEDEESAVSSAAPAAAASASRRRSAHRPQHSAIASYVPRPHSAHNDTDPFAIRREIHIVQNVESIDLDDLASAKDSTSVSLHDLGLRPQD